MPSWVDEAGRVSMNKVEDVYKYVRGVYECKEFSSYQDLIDNTEIVLRENENEDNKFYLIQTEYGNLGFTYYHLGTKPSIILKNYILFMGFGTSIVVYDIFRKELLYRITNAMHVAYDLQYNSFFENIIVVCELCVLGFDCKGQLLWENNFRDSIVDYIIEEQSVEIRFEDASVLMISIGDGRFFSNSLE